MSGITEKLVGGKTTKDTAFTDMSQSEIDRLKAIEGDLTSLGAKQGAQADTAATQGADFQKMFADQLKQFMLSDHGPNPTPDQIKSATDFVDQTFTNPAQQQLKQYGQDFGDQAAAKAAALGRNPNADIATQQAIAGEIARQGMGLQSERGSRIAQESRALNDASYNRGLSGLQVGQSGTGFLNDLQQRALSNQIGLLNGRTGLANFYQNERRVGKYGTSSGILTNATSVVNGVNDLGSSMNNAVIGGFGSVGALGQVGQTAQSFAPSKDQMSMMGGGAAMMSDRRLKTNIEANPEALYAAFDTVNPYKFNYTNKLFGSGDYYGVMAQDLEKSEAGRSLVVNTEAGKAIDTNKAISMLLAHQAVLVKEIKALKAKIG